MLPLETTAMTLNAALGFMALHPQYQEEMYEEVKTIMPNAADFVSGDRHTEARLD